MRTKVDDYLLELILLDTIAVSGKRPLPGAERIIQRLLPAGLYDRLIERYDALTGDYDADEQTVLWPWLRKAAGRDSRWKRRMIINFLCVLRTGGPLGTDELAEVAALAARMGAGRECRQVFAHLRPRARGAAGAARRAIT